MSCGILINEKILTHGGCRQFCKPFLRLVTVAYARASNSHLALDGTVRDAS